MLFFVAVTPTAGFQDLATIHLFKPVQGNILEFSHRGDPTANRPTFVPHAMTDTAWLCFPLTNKSSVDEGGKFKRGVYSNDQ